MLGCMPIVLALLLTATPSLRERLVGTWRDPDDPTITITYRKNGSGESAGNTFRWVIEEGNKLTLTFDGGGAPELAWITITGDDLTEIDIVTTETIRWKRVTPRSGTAPRRPSR